MSGRNWTRKSIEELVEAYMRGKKRPSSTGGESFCVYDTAWIGISANDPITQSNISVGYLNNTPEVMASGHSYYPALNGAPADYIEGSYTTYGQTRATQYSGSKSLSNGGFVTGKIMRTGQDNNPRAFTILTVPKTCTLSNLKDLIVRTSAGLMPLTGYMALVTSDYANMDADQINRTMYIASVGGEPMYLIGENVCWWNNFYGEAIYTPRSGNEYYIESSNNTGRFTKSGQYVSSNTYQMVHGMHNAGVTYISSFRTSGLTDTTLDRFFNYVKSHYTGTLTYGSDTRNLNFLTFIILKGGSGAGSNEEVEKCMFYLSRLFVDNVFSNTSFYDVDLYGSGKPRFISENPTWDSSIPMAIYGGILPSTMVQYNKEYVTLA